MDTPFLSIIVPVYNSRPYLKTLISSLCAQTVQGFEVIFVDDGSSDGSYDELHRLTEQVPFSVTIHRQENAGVSTARNNGVSLATGNYLSFVDSDDALHPAYTETLKEQSTADVLLFRSLRKQEGEKMDAAVYEQPILSVTPKTMLTRFVANPTAFSMCNVFIRRDFYEQHALSFKAGYKYYEDYELLCRTLFLAEDLYMAERDLYFYIQRSDSAMTRFTVDRLSCMILIEQLQDLLIPDVPAFEMLLPRLYWSVMWQASVAFSFGDACRFAKAADIKRYLKKLSAYPDRKVRLSSRLFGICPPLFVAAARLLKRGAKTQPTDITPFLEYLQK